MAYGSLKVDNIIFTNGGVDQTITVSGIVAATSGNLTVTGTISGAVVQGGTLVSGATVTGGTGQFTTLTGGTAGFTTITGTTVTGTTAQFTSITGGGIGATTITGTTVSGTTANFASGVFTTQISGATVTGTTANFTSGNFTNISGGTQTVTSGVFAAGSATNPSISFTSDPNTGIYSPGADQVAISTNGVGRVFINASGLVSAGTTSADSRFTAANISTTDAGAVELKGQRNFVAETHGATAIVATSNQTRNSHDFGAIRFEQNPDTNNGGAALVRFYVGGASSSFTGANEFLRATAQGTDGSSNIQFRTGNFERMRLDSSGRLGLGTSSPASALDVQSGSIKLRNAGSGTNYGYEVDVNHVTGVSQKMLSARYMIPGESGSYTDIAGINAEIENASFNIYGLSLRTGGATAGGVERVRIDGSGRVGIGTTSPSQALHVVSASTQALFEGSIQGNIIIQKAGTSGFAIGSDAAGTLNFYDNNASSFRLKIDSSGRLLVGTSTAVGTSNAVIIKGTSGVSNASIYLGNASNASTLVDGNTLGFLEFGAADGGTGAQILGVADGTWSSTSDCPSRLVFSTTADGASSPTERMRIYSSGETRVVSEGTVFGAFTTQAAGTSTALFLGRRSATAGNMASGTDCIIIWSNGNVVNTNNSYGAISDIKLKENIVDAGSQWDDLKALKVRKYNFKEGQTHTQIGLVAQEVELVSPGLVSESPDRDKDGNDLGTVTKSVNYSVLYMKAVKALQEAMERIETLEAKVAALEAS